MSGNFADILGDPDFRVNPVSLQFKEVLSGFEFLPNSCHRIAVFAILCHL